MPPVYIYYRIVKLSDIERKNFFALFPRNNPTKKKLFFFTNTLLATFSADMEDEFISALVARNSSGMETDDGTELALDAFSVYRICRQCFRFRQFRLASRIAKGNFQKNGNRIFTEIFPIKNVLFKAIFSRSRISIRD